MEQDRTTEVSPSREPRLMDALSSTAICRSKARCLVLACGNTLRCDDGVGPWLAAWAEDCFRAEPELRVIVRQQWTPDLAEEIACAERILFMDCSAESAPGVVLLREVHPAERMHGTGTHHQGAAELLALAQDLYGAQPTHAQVLTVGAGCTELGESFSAAVVAALPKACSALESTMLQILRSISGTGVKVYPSTIEQPR